MEANNPLTSANKKPYQAPRITSRLPMQSLAGFCNSEADNVQTCREASCQSVGINASSGI